MSAPSFRDVYLYIYWQTGGPPLPLLLLYLLLLSWKPWPGTLSTREINSEALGDGKYLLSSRGAVWRAYSVRAQPFHAAVSNYTHNSIFTKGPETRERGVLLLDCGDLALCGPL